MLACFSFSVRGSGFTCRHLGPGTGQVLPQTKSHPLRSEHGRTSVVIPEEGQVPGEVGKEGTEI